MDHIGPGDEGKCKVLGTDFGVNVFAECKA